MVREKSGNFALLKLWTPCQNNLDSNILCKKGKENESRYKNTRCVKKYMVLEGEEEPTKKKNA